MMAEDDSNEEVRLYLVALEVEGKHPTVVFCLSNPLQRIKNEDSGILCRTLFGSDQVPILEATKQNNALLMFLRAGHLFESVELELTTDVNLSLCNVEMIIDPSKETAILTAYDTTEEGSLFWKSTNVYSVVSALDSKVNSYFTQAVGHCDVNENLNLIFGGTACRYRGCISKVTFYPLGIEFHRDFATNGLLGKGAYGTVYKCSRGAAQFAVKKKVASVGNQCSEVESMVKLSGTKHVVQIYSAWHQPNSFVFITMELFERNLEEYLAARTGVDLRMSTLIFTEIMVGVNSIHEAGIIHRDLKPMNILLDNNNHISIADFGIAKIKPHPTAEASYPGNPTYGTQFYCDPLLNSPHYQHNEMVDIYSCGIIYFEMHLLGVTKRRCFLRKFCDKLSFSKRSSSGGYDIWMSSLWSKWGGDKNIMRSMVAPAVTRQGSSYYLEKLLVTAEELEDTEARNELH